MNIFIKWRLISSIALDIFNEIQIEKLKDCWVDEECFIESISSQKYNLTEAYYIFNLLQKKGYLEMSVNNSDGKSLFALSPAIPIKNNEEVSLASLKWNKYVYIHSIDEKLTIASSLKPNVITINSLELSKLFVSLNNVTKNNDIEEINQAINSDTKRLFINIVLSLGYLEDKSTPDLTPQWEFHDRLFYSKTTYGCSVSHKGKKIEMPNNFSMPPITKAIAAEKRIKLEEIDNKTYQLLNAPYNQVLQSRRSRREFADSSLSFQLLSAFLTVSLKIQEIRSNIALEHKNFNYDIYLSPSPSGGALHSLETYLKVDRVDNIEKGLYHYNPLNNELEFLSSKIEIQEKKDLESTPQVKIIITSRIARTSYKYENIAYRLILIDLGCMLQTMMLTAESLQLKSYIVGAISKNTLSAIQIDENDEIIIGSLILGK